jgi:hypothetical protein
MARVIPYSRIGPDCGVTLYKENIYKEIIVLLLCFQKGGTISRQLITLCINQINRLRANSFLEERAFFVY